MHQAQRSLAEDGIRVPVLSGGKGKLTWQPPSYGYVHRILTNPMYAGAYVFGQWQTEEVLDSNHRPMKRQRTKPQKEWHALIQNHHEGYVSWEMFEKNLARIARGKSGELEGKRVRVGRRLGWRIRLQQGTSDDQPTLFDNFTQ